MANKGSSAVLKRNSANGAYVVAVPRSVRKASGLKEGDAVVFSLTPDGRTIMRPKTGSLKDLRGVTSTKIKASDKVIQDARGAKSNPTPTSAAKKR